MTREYRPIDPRRIKTYSVKKRHHKASLGGFARLTEPGSSVAGFCSSLPDYLGARAFRGVVSSIVAAVRNDRPVVFAFGAHVIKVGCGPIVIDLIRRGIVKALACNGACAIHDVEVAMLGETSEEVADTIRDGSFGMVAETLEFFDAAAARCKNDAAGLGETIGSLIIERMAPNRELSVFAAAKEARIPICVHVALGTDTVHVSPGADGAAWGQASLRDFRLLCDVVCDLGAGEGADCGGQSPLEPGFAGGQSPLKSGFAGGVWLNVGSAVVLPEVFLKAVSVARNLGANLDAMVTANFDMIRHYRPHQNVVTRPVSPGRGFDIVGHHEIMLPLLRQAVIDELGQGRTGAQTP